MSSHAQSAAQEFCDAYSTYLHYDTVTNSIVWVDATRMPFGSERAGITFDECLNSATVFDQVSMPYPREWPQTAPPLNSDPGRMRCEAFFKKLYGETARDVQRNLVRVPWPAAGPKRSVRFTSVNGANKALVAVGAELAALPGDARRYVAHPDGTFNWRRIEGTTRLSPHCFGIAVDFKMPGCANPYWRWNNGVESVVSAQSNHPTGIFQDDALRQVVETFERHGFIWGGKWYHYDLMHFEYRPELLP